MVKDDLHDISKNIISSVMQGGGIEMIDLGGDVPPEKFVEAVARERLELLGLSAVLTTVVPNVDWLNFSVGTIYYRFPNTVFHPTTEVYGGLSLPTVPLTPSFKWFRDVDESEGSYYQFGVGQFFEKIFVMNEKCYCGLQLGASYGWANSAYNSFYFGKDGGHSNDLTLSAGLCTQLYSWMVKPSVNYSTMLSDSIRSATDKSDNVWMGVGISTSF